MRKRSIEERLLTRTDKNGPVPGRRPDLGRCWIWLGNINGHGYGVFSRGRNACTESFELYKGKLAPGYEPDHLCRIRACINPDHLEAVTHRENLLRGDGVAAINAAKTHCPRGHELVLGNLVSAQLRRGQRYCLTCAKSKDANRSLPDNARRQANLRLTRRVVEALLSA